MAKTLRVLPSHDALVPDYEAAEAGVRRYIGRRHDPSHGSAGGFAPTGEIVEVPDRHEYREELIAATRGHRPGLLPADETTAQAVGLTLRPAVEVR